MKGEKWKEAQDSDNQRGEDLFTRRVDEGEGGEGNYYVRTKSDVRTLFEMKPPRVKKMRLGQFASRYRKIKPKGCGFQSAKDKINPDTGVGPDSSERLFGDEHLMAPQSMQLTNGDVMVKRSGKNAVLHLRYDGKTGRHGKQVLWSSWRFLEEIRDQVVFETEDQMERRLEVFPLSKEEEEDDLV